MGVRIGHASISENGTINGAKGDSTKREVCVRDFYNINADFMAVYPDEKIRNTHAQMVEDGCANDNIGYGQGDRNTANTEAKKVNYVISKIKTKCNTDCSAFQNLCAVAAKAPGAVYGGNGWTTRTMFDELAKLGYVIIIKSGFLSTERVKEYQKKGYKIVVNGNLLTSSVYCVRGAIYVRAGHHTVCGLDNGSKYKETLTAAGLVKGETPKEPKKKEPEKKPSTPTKTKTATNAAKSSNSKLSGTYQTTTSLNMRNGAGTNYSIMTTLPEKTKVKNYGYYTEVSKVKWLYVQVTLNNVTYSGFCSEKYLKKI